MRALLARLAARLRPGPPPLGGDSLHPWFHGFRDQGPPLPAHLPGTPLAQTADSGDQDRPVFFLARGHSGTRALARLLDHAGVFMGRGPQSLNDTWDALHWAYGFERTLVPRLFRPGRGCLVHREAVLRVGRECARRHLRGHRGGPWGAKTCAAMFAHPLYRTLYPRARYIHMLRDGRDVTLSHDGLLNLTGADPGHPNWEFFRIITYGISDDMALSPFPFPRTAGQCGPLRAHRYWVQAKSWIEHVRMMERLRQDDELAPQVHTIRYEALCADPVPVLEGLFAFLELELPAATRDFARGLFHTRGVGRWRAAAALPADAADSPGPLWAFMAPELQLCGYGTNPNSKEQP